MANLLADYWPVIIMGVCLASGIAWWLITKRRAVSPGIDAQSGGFADAPAPIPPVNVPPAPGPLQDLTCLYGVTAREALLLSALGVRRYEQLAAIVDSDLPAVERHLSLTKDRVQRERWREQARLLADEKIAEFEAEYGALAPSRI